MRRRAESNSASLERDSNCGGIRMTNCGGIRMTNCGGIRMIFVANKARMTDKLRRRIQWHEYRCFVIS